MNMKKFQMKNKILKGFHKYFLCSSDNCSIPFESIDGEKNMWKPKYFFNIMCIFYSLSSVS